MSARADIADEVVERIAVAAVAMLDAMIAARREYAAEQGFEATDEEIAADIIASLRRRNAARAEVAS